MRRFLPLLVVTLISIGGCADPPAEPLRVGSAAPEFVLRSVAGGELRRSSLLGTPVILNFWATWCQPCRREFPVLTALDRDHRVEVVTIALDEDGEESVRPFLRRADLDYTVLLGDEKTFRRFGGFAIPYTLVLDSEHTVVSVYRGPVAEEDLRRDLARINGEPNAVSAVG